MKKKMECFVEWFFVGGLSIFIGIISLIEAYGLPEEQVGWIIFCASVSVFLFPIGTFCFIEGLVKHIKLILKEKEEEEEEEK